MDNLSIELKAISIEGEIWKPFVKTSLKDYYISDKGRFIAVYPVNFKREKKHYSLKIISPYQNGKGYNIVRTTENGNTNYYQVHRAVLMTFSPIEGMENLQVNHKDGNKSNNYLDNLEWCTCSENNKHAIQTGLRKNPTKGKFGKEHIASKPIVCVETGRVYNCQREVAEELGEDYRWTSHLSRACRYGLLDHGFHWRYYEPNELVRLLFEKSYNKYPLSYDGDYWFCYIQMAMKWLREVYGLHISLEPCYDYDSMHVVFLAFVQNVADVHEFFDGRKNVASYPNAEKSYELAIKYCLENLI